jgi:hypothetical protein
LKQRLQSPLAGLKCFDFLKVEPIRVRRDPDAHSGIDPAPGETLIGGFRVVDDS